jgi:hypothetical protein
MPAHDLKGLGMMAGLCRYAIIEEFHLQQLPILD